MRRGNSEERKIMNYFAYGSNMDPKRLANRGLVWTKDEVAVLDGYEMRCNVLCDRIAQQYPGCGTANITIKAGGKVEGILYTLPDGELEKLDVFEVGLAASKHRRSS